MSLLTTELCLPVLPHVLPAPADAPRSHDFSYGLPGVCHCRCPARRGWDRSHPCGRSPVGRPRKGTWWVLSPVFLHERVFNAWKTTGGGRGR